MRCPACGHPWERHRKVCTRCGARRVRSAEEDARVVEPAGSRLVGGYLYPLDIAAILDASRAEAYSEECAERARRHPDSARNALARRRKRERAAVG